MTPQERSCTSKVAHATEMMARMSAQRQIIKNSRLHAMWVYPCDFCDKWHISSRPSGLGRVTLKELKAAVR